MSKSPAPFRPDGPIRTANDITRILVAFQPHRGTIVRADIPGVVTKDQLKSLTKEGYLQREEIKGVKEGPRYHFTAKAYAHLGKVVPS